MKHSIKRVQSQAGLSFAEREDVRPKVKQKLLFLLVLLMTATTGAWAQEETLLTTITATGQTTYSESTAGVVTVSHDNDYFDNTFGWLWYEHAGSVTVEAKDGYTITRCVFSQPYKTPFTVSTAPFKVDFIETSDPEMPEFKQYLCQGYMDGVSSIEVYGYAPAAAPATYSVSLAEGTEDFDKWTISPTEAAEGSPVTVTYSGERKVKSVKAVKAAKPDLLSGVFSVSSTKKVNFSKGNLRYASSKWSFFDNQYDYYTSHSADAWDHFGWSTSATTYGMSTSSNNDDYSGDFVDWGATMGAGWRTLTSDEWAYLLKTRSASTVNGTENGRYAKAKVNDVVGVILFPDTYTHPDGVAAPTGVNATDEYGWEGNSYTAADWTKMESAGCVFLPAAGCRYGSEMIGLGSYGYYGSATPDGADYAYRVKFNSGSLEPANSINRCLGCSVRLVQAVSDAGAPAAKPAATVTTAPTGAAIVGVGKTTALVSGGVADGGTMMYKVTTENTKPASTDGFSADVPTAQGITASGKVYVWYYVKGDDTHSDSEIAATAIEVTVKAFPITVTWNPSDIVPEHLGDDSFTKDGITFTAATCDFQVLTFGGGGSFTTTLGNFTKIEISADFTGDVSGTGWSNDGWQSATWTGNAASVSFSGDIWGGGMTCEGGNLTIVFTIE